MKPFDYAEQCWQLTHKVALYRSRNEYLESTLRQIATTDSWAGQLARKALEHDNEG